jgi:DNA primase
MAKAVREAVAFVRFRVERVLADGDDSTPEGRDRMLDELRPLFATLPESAMRMEMTRLVSNRLALPDRLAEKLMASSPGGEGGTPRGAGAGAGGGAGAVEGAREGAEAGPGGGELAGREETERAFLALCIASPQDGAEVLAGLDLEEHFSSPLVRRAAARLRDGDLAIR